MAALVYRIYLQDRLSGNSQASAIYGLSRRIFGIRYLIPLNPQSYPAEKVVLVTRANKALKYAAIFFAFVLV